MDLDLFDRNLIEVTIQFNDVNNFLCENCGLTFSSMKSIEKHKEKLHQFSKLNLNLFDIFTNGAKNRGYPSWLVLPNKVQQEIAFIFDNFTGNTLLKKISELLQTDFSSEIHWSQNAQKFGDADLKFILGSMLPQIVWRQSQ
ncbi:uncharacterized protein LOC113475566 isoform X1 [Ciona intestinalis]